MEVRPGNRLADRLERLHGLNGIDRAACQVRPRGVQGGGARVHDERGGGGEQARLASVIGRRHGRLAQDHAERAVVGDDGDGQGLGRLREQAPELRDSRVGSHWG